jgi:hypothetical protein
MYFLSKAITNAPEMALLCNREFRDDLTGLVSRYRWDSDKTDVLGLACYDAHGFTFVTVAARNTPYLLNATP